MTATGATRHPVLAWVFCSGLGAWALWSLVATAAAPHGVSWARASGLAAAAAIGIGVVLVRPPTRWVVVVVAAAAGAVVAWGYAEWVTVGLAHGTMNGPFSLENPFGAIAATAAVLALVPVCDAGRPWPVRLVAAVAAAVAGQALVRSGSMGSLIAMGAGTAAVLVGAWRRGATSTRSPRASSAWVAGCLVIGVAVAALGVGLVVSRLAATTPDEEPTSGLGVDTENHAAEHVEIWADAAEVWFDHPWMGAGPARLPVIVAGLEDARSDVVNALAETGVPGALAWAMAISCAAIAAVLVEAHPPGAAAVALAAATIVLGVYSLVDTTAAWPFLAGLLWTCAGGAVAVVRARPAHS
ncbi:MAG: O-antigen ligase family protein [Acidimicrobiia bacterium]|nr:O-antigen ligase family protein [Acidimicrobiia bacterium]